MPLPKRIAVVCDCASHLGQEVVKQLHAEFEVRGVTSNLAQGASSPYLSQVINKSDDDAVRAQVLGADLVVCQLEDDALFSQRAIRLVSTAHFETEKSFVLVSSALTWTNAKTEDEDEGDDAEEETEEAEEEPEMEEEEPEPWTEEQFVSRKPAQRYQSWFETERMVKKANSDTLHTYVLWAGLIYGGGEDALRPLFNRAWQLNRAGLPLFALPTPQPTRRRKRPKEPAPGSNWVPMIHVRDLAKFVVKLALVEDKEEQRYFFAVDNGAQTWRDLVKCLSTALGNGRTHVVPLQDRVLHRQVEQFTLNVRATPGAIASHLDADDWTAEMGFVENVAGVIQEYKDALGLQPIRLCLLGPPLCGKTYLSGLLSEHYKTPTFTVQQVINEYQQHKVELEKEVAGIRKQRRDARRLERAEEKRRLQEEKEAEAAENEDEEQEEQPDDAPEDGDEEEEDEADSEDEEEDVDAEDDEELQAVLDRLRQVETVLKMRIRPKKAPEPEVDEEEVDEDAPKKRKGTFLKGKLRIKTANDAPPPAPVAEVRRFNDKALAHMYRWKLGQPGCKNQGYIMDGFPKTPAQARLLFDDNELEIPDAIDEEEEEPEEEADPDAEGEEDEDRRGLDSLLPDCVVQLSASDKFLTERLMTPGTSTYSSPGEFLRRLTAFKKQFQGAKPRSVATYFEGMLTNKSDGPADAEGEPRPRELVLRQVGVDRCPITPPPPPANDLEDRPMDAAAAEIISFLGEPRNFGASPHATELRHQRAAYQAKIRAAEEDAAAAALAAQQAAEKEALLQLKKREAVRLAHVRAQQLESADTREQPSRKYLMENVIPAMTKALTDLCEARPEDPIDYLANWLYACDAAAYQ